MVRAKLKLISILLITAILCAGCEVPDLTEFTKQSAEMTRGIRTGVKDTESVIKTASERKDLFSDTERARFRQDLKTYREALKPTVEALDALDAYLDALNALAQANKKSAENSTAVVNAVSGLVTAVSGLTFASPALDVASGLLTIAEQFRTTRDFKKRVNLAAQIVEGGVTNKVDASGKNVVDANGKPVFVKACTGNAETEITREAGTIKTLVSTATERLSDDQRQQLQPLSPQERRQKLQDFGMLNAAQVDQISRAEKTIASFKCGVIDLLKFNVQDLIKINLNVSRLTLNNARQKHQAVLGYYEAILKTDQTIQDELRTILGYKSVAAQIRELEATDGTRQSIIDQKVFLKNHATELFALDGQVRNDIFAELDDCKACGSMRQFFEFKLCDTCEAAFESLLDKIQRSEFDTSNGRIEQVLERRAAKLYEQNTMYLEELKRITPAHSAALAELDAFSKKQQQLDQLLGASVSALDAWAKSHANLRVAVNTKKPLGVSQLAAKVREIWSIINPAEKS